MQETIERLQALFDKLPGEQKIYAAGYACYYASGGRIEPFTDPIGRDEPYWQLKLEIDNLPESIDAVDFGKPAQIHKELWKAWMHVI